MLDFVEYTAHSPTHWIFNGFVRDILCGSNFVILIIFYFFCIQLFFYNFSVSLTTCFAPKFMYSPNTFCAVGHNEPEDTYKMNCLYNFKTKCTAFCILLCCALVSVVQIKQKKLLPLFASFNLIEIRANQWNQIKF